MLAVGSWLWVQGREVETARVRLEMSYRLPEELVAVDPLPGTSVVKVRGSRMAVRQAQRKPPTLLVDLRGVGVGTHEARLDTFAIEDLPSGLELVAFVPDSFAVRLDQRLRRNVEVQATWMGEPAPARDVRSVKLTPSVVEVSGPRALVERLESVSTLPIDVSGWDGSRTVPVELDLPRAISTTAAWQGQAEVEVASLVSTRQLTEVPVVVPDPAWRPAHGSERISVRLTGPTDVLRALRADQVLARVELPPAPKGRRYTASYGGDRAPRFEILVPRAEVRVESAPATVEVERR